MDGAGGRSNKAAQDAATVEVGYALISAGFAGAVVFGAVAGPALLFDLPGPLAVLLPRSGLALAAVVFVARVASVWIRFRRGPRAGA